LFFVFILVFVLKSNSILRPKVTFKNGMAKFDKRQLGGVRGQEYEPLLA
jgi:hypothetical protein